MSQVRKTKCVIRIYEQFGLRKNCPGSLRLTLDEVKKYASKTPLRLPPPRKP
jgi:hypothetical protein